jgi:peptide/nickel transport system substrate-binding protein
MKHRRRILAGLAAVLALPALAACSGGSANGGTGGSGPTLRIGLDKTVDSVNPFVAVESTSLAVFKYIYPSLVQYNANLKMAPNYATTWTSSANALTWTFHLHSRAKWSDGQPMTAADVAWTVNTTLKYAAGGGAEMATYLSGVKSVAAPNPTTAVFTLSKPTAAFLSNMAVLPILPKHVWSKYTTGKDGAGLRTFANTPSSGNPVVSGGPFICTQYQATGVDLFERNPNYYGAKPQLAGFGLQYFSSTDAEVEALKNGGIDVILAAPASAAKTLAADSALTVDSKPALAESDIIINDNPKWKSHPELQNPQVRQAFDMAVDRNAIVKNAFDGYARPASSIIPLADSAWHDSATSPPPFDLAKANQLLDAAGYKRGPNGVRVADGRPMSYDVILATDEQGARTRAFDIIQTDFAKIGVKLALKVTDDSAAANLELSPSTKFTIGMWGYNPPGVDPNFLLNTYTCAQYGGWNESGYCSKAYDALFNKQATTLNPAKRKQIVFQMQKMLQQATPEVMYVYEDVNDAWSNKWTGFGENGAGLFSSLTTDGIVNAHQG